MSIEPESNVTPRGFPLAAAIGVAALAMGVGFGLWARPDLLRTPSPMRPAPATAAATGPDGKVSIVVNPARAPEAPQPRSDGPLEVLPPDMAAAARAEAERALGPKVPAPQIAETAAPNAQPGYDCRRATTPAERLICSDGQLAAADRRLTRAYERAVAAGVPQSDLRAEQDDWLSIREDAARYSAQAVADVYNQRIHELEQMAGPADDW